MKLYAVIYSYYEDFEILGIFSTEEKAQERINKIEYIAEANNCDIEEFELDESRD